MEKEERSLLFVFNPYAGKGEIKYHLLDIVNTFAKHDYKVTIHPTQGQKDAFNYIAKNGSEYDMIACSGGDGTLNEVISGVMKLEDRPVVGYIPSGTTNDFAKGLKLPSKMTRAAKILMKGEPQRIDIGAFNEKSFVYVAAFGAFTEVSYATPQDMKNTLGHAAYLIEGLKSLPTIKSVHVSIKADNFEAENEDFLFGSITNAVSVGGFNGITGKDVDLTDGKFEVILVKRARNPIELQNIINIFMGIDIKGTNVIKFQTSKLLFKTEEEVPWVLDGEYGGSPKKVTIQNMHKAITVMSNTGKIVL